MLISGPVDVSDMEGEVKMMVDSCKTFNDEQVEKAFSLLNEADDKSKPFLKEVIDYFYFWYLEFREDFPIKWLLKESMQSDDTENEDGEVGRLKRDYESVNNQLNVANKMIIKYKRQARYKTGQTSDKDLEKLADAVRFESSKLINFNKLGDLLGCSGVTAKKAITDRLPYLLQPKDF